MVCPFCKRELQRNEIEMSGSFDCPHCHKLLRLRRNFTVRIMRLAFITALLAYCLIKISLFFHFPWLSAFGYMSGAGAYSPRGAARLLAVLVAIILLVVGFIDEYIMRLLPPKIDPAVDGSLEIQ